MQNIGIDSIHRAEDVLDKLCVLITVPEGVFNHQMIIICDQRRREATWLARSATSRFMVICVSSLAKKLDSCIFVEE